MNITAQFIYNEIERKLPDLRIYEYQYDRFFDEEEFNSIVKRVYYKYGLLTPDFKPDEEKLWHLGVKEFVLDQIYRNYLNRIGAILVKNDEKVSKIIDEAITHTGRFAEVKAEPITELQLYRVINGRKVNDLSCIDKKSYEWKQNHYYGTLTQREWYTTYLQRRKRLTEEKKIEEYKIKEHKPDDHINYGYKGLDKIKSLNEHYGKEYVEPKEQITNYFPLKRNMKNYTLHKVRPRNSWLIDLMKSGKIYYLLAINVNTRYLLAEPTNATIEESKDADGIVTVSNSVKNEKICADVMQKLINHGWEPKYIESDGEGGFSSDYVKRVIYERYNIKYQQVRRQKKTVYPSFMKDESKKWNKKTEPIHGSLGIIDRVTRTIRDMAYNMKIGVILPPDMKKIVEYYNNAPHKGLSKYAGFSVTPSMVQNDSNLEEWIVRKIMQKNYEIMNRKGFKLNSGTNVKVYNEKDSLSKRRTVIQPGEFIIDGFNKGLFKVKNKTDNSIQLIPRYKLHPVV